MVYEIHTRWIQTNIHVRYYKCIDFNGFLRKESDIGTTNFLRIDIKSMKSRDRKEREGRRGWGQIKDPDPEPVQGEEH